MLKVIAIAGKGFCENVPPGRARLAEEAAYRGLSLTHQRRLYFRTSNAAKFGARTMRA